MSSILNSLRSFRDRNIPEWSELISKIFGVEKPHNAFWQGKADTLQILKKLSLVNNNAAFIYTPDGESINITRVEKSLREGCIEIYDGKQIYVIEPTELSYLMLQEESTYKNLEWSYFKIHMKNEESLFFSINKMWMDSYGEYQGKVDDENETFENEDGKPVKVRSSHIIVNQIIGNHLYIFPSGSIIVLLLNSRNIYELSKIYKMNDNDFISYVINIKRALENN